MNNTENRKSIAITICEAIILTAVLLMLVVVSAQSDKNEKLTEENELLTIQLETEKIRADNANERAQQWMEMYHASLIEIADLKDAIDAQTTVLDEPPADAYTSLEWDFDYVVRVVGAEARGEPFEGKVAVAVCIANTAKRLGITPEQVVKMPNRYAAPVGRNVLDGMEEVDEACCQVFFEGYNPFDEPIEYFYDWTLCTSQWHENLTYAFTIGSHKFFTDGKEA